MPTRFRLQPRLHSRGGLDSRREVARIWGRLEIKSSRHILRTLICLAVAPAAAFLPEYAGLSPAGVRALFILVFAAGLWVSEAIPAFAVGLLVIALEVVLLGKPAEAGGEWERYIVVWGHPLIWLFFGGLVLAAGAAKTGLDRWLAAKVLPLFGTRPASLMLGVMLITFVFSMFMSNTATTAMMIMVLGPLLAHIDQNDPFSRGLLLSLCVAANVGGMATIIGTPPNAIAAGMLDSVPGQQLDFGRWMLISNTAAANILVPIGLAMMVGFEASVVVPIAMGASAAMALPISTPPNAIVFTSGRLEVRDFLGIGLLMGVLAPLLVVFWTRLILERILG